MAQYQVTHTCGHSSTLYLTGKGSSRQWRIDRAKEEDCPDCRQKARDIANAAATEQAKAIAEKAGLPALVGSPKQIALAESLRIDFIERKAAEVRDLAEKLVNQPHYTPAQRKCLLDNLDAAIVEACASDNAKWWIDYRDQSANTILRDWLSDEAPSKFDVGLLTWCDIKAKLLALNTPEQNEAIKAKKIADLTLQIDHATNRANREAQELAEAMERIEFLKSAGKDKDADRALSGAQLIQQSLDRMTKEINTLIAKRDALMEG